MDEDDLDEGAQRGPKSVVDQAVWVSRPASSEAMPWHARKSAPCILIGGLVVRWPSVVKSLSSRKRGSLVCSRLACSLVWMRTPNARARAGDRSGGMGGGSNVTCSDLLCATFRLHVLFGEFGKLA